ncbi:MAG: twin-arginine translocase TatA/TatE family subunit [Chloroflexi bacterium]|nr:twin-arginine translocase TatA/TatE family subunit [Chloroflexota bacterium]
MFAGALQPWHLILILVIVLIVFGPGKLPDLGKSLGKSISEFKKSTSGEYDEVRSTTAVADGPRVCAACKTENAPGNQFCGNCGAKLA